MSLGILTDLNRFSEAGAIGEQGFTLNGLAGVFAGPRLCGVQGLWTTLCDQRRRVVGTAEQGGGRLVAVHHAPRWIAIIGCPGRGVPGRPLGHPGWRRCRPVIPFRRAVHIGSGHLTSNHSAKNASDHSASDLIAGTVSMAIMTVMTMITAMPVMGVIAIIVRNCGPQQPAGDGAEEGSGGLLVSLCGFTAESGGRCARSIEGLMVGQCKGGDAHRGQHGNQTGLHHFSSPSRALESRLAILWSSQAEQELKPELICHLDEGWKVPHLKKMGLVSSIAKTAGRARYTAAQGLRSAWYGGQYVLARRRSAGFNRPGEPPFQPRNAPDRKALQAAFLDLFRQDRANVEAGLYADPVGLDLDPMRLPRTVRRARQFLRDVAEVDRRRLARDGTEVRRSAPTDLSRFPAYYRQNFHYQTDGWFSEDSAEIYDHQVEALFTGAAAAMRRAALAALAKELKGCDQRAYRVLDVGCGTGQFMHRTLHNYPRLRLTGLDLSPAYAEAARQATRRWGQASVVEGQAEAMPFESGSFDSLVSIYLFHELPPRIRPVVIAEAARVLRPGGAFVIADSLQFGDNAGLDGFLEYFPEGFHEPYYKGYLSWDFAPAMQAQGFERESTQLAFLTKVSVWRKAN